MENLSKEEIDIGGKIREIRLLQKMTQAEFGALLGKSQSTIYAYEKNLVIPPFKTMLDICRIFSVTLDYLMGYNSKGGIWNIRIFDVFGAYKYYRHLMKVFEIEDE